MSALDAFGVERPDLLAKSRHYNSVEGRKQRAISGVAGAALTPVGAPVFGAMAAPKGHKAGAAARALGRSAGEGILGGTAGSALGNAVSVATKGKLHLAPVLGGRAGALGGLYHGTSASVGTTQRRYQSR